MSSHEEMFEYVRWYWGEALQKFDLDEALDPLGYFSQVGLPLGLDWEYLTA